MCDITDQPRKEFTREELQAIKGKASNERDTVMNADWKRALTHLIDAADTMDAMIARKEARK